MHRPNTLQRAFELAKSGEVASLEQLASRLTREGFLSVHDHLLGRGIRKQLSDIIKANQTPIQDQGENHTE